jgi:hypothetical protein
MVARPGHARDNQKGIALADRPETHESVEKVPEMPDFLRRMIRKLLIVRSQQVGWRREKSFSTVSHVCGHQNSRIPRLSNQTDTRFP